MRRERFESAPDIADVPGFAVEVKYRKRLPRLVVEALRQAEGYAILGQRPVAVLFERGSREGIAVLRLADFATVADEARVRSVSRPVEAPHGLPRGQGRGDPLEAVHAPGEPRLPHAQGASVLKADSGEDKGPRASEPSPEP